jgi:hypothetical protein
MYTVPKASLEFEIYLKDSAGTSRLFRSIFYVGHNALKSLLVDSMWKSAEVFGTVLSRDVDTHNFTGCV